jgi:hypothetical protein
MYELINLTAVENFPSVVKLDVFDCPELKRINGLYRLHKIRIMRCPKLEELEGVPVLDSLTLYDGTMETLPLYLTVLAQGTSVCHATRSCMDPYHHKVAPSSIRSAIFENMTYRCHRGLRYMLARNIQIKIEDCTAGR